MRFAIGCAFMFGLTVFGTGASLAGESVRKVPVAPNRDTRPDDLGIQTLRHHARCPPPGEEVCAMKAPVEGGMTVLTPGVSVDSESGRWLVSFRGFKPGSSSGVFRVLGSNGALHEINVSFAFSVRAAEMERAKVETEKKAAEAKALAAEKAAKGSGRASD